MTRIHSAAGSPLPDSALLDRPPFRAPHHQASIVSLIGGGSWSLRPGEVSLATHGILFLDELGEFPIAALEALRQPLEEGVIRVSRAGGTVTFPAAFLLVAAMNPCPCGEGVYEGACRCSVVARARYRRRLSAPLLDRFDLVVAAEPARSRRPALRHAGRVVGDRRGPGRGRTSTVVECRRAGVSAAAAATPRPCLAAKLRSGELSARGLHKVSRVAQTVATLDGDEVGDVRARRRGPRPASGRAVVAT